MVLCLWSTPTLAKQTSQKKPHTTLALNTLLTPKKQMDLHTEDLRAWMMHHYEQYPEELAKSTQVGAKEMVEWVFDGKNNWKFEALGSLQGQEALALLFDASYQGDRILALVVGIESLLFNAYGAKNEYAIPPDVAPEKLSQVICSLHQLDKQIIDYQSSTLATHATSFLNDQPSNKSFKQLLNNITERIQANLPDKIFCSNE